MKGIKDILNYKKTRFANKNFCLYYKDGKLKAHDSNFNSVELNDDQLTLLGAYNFIERAAKISMYETGKQEFSYKECVGFVVYRLINDVCEGRININDYMKNQGDKVDEITIGNAVEVVCNLKNYENTQVEKSGRNITFDKVFGKIENDEKYIDIYNKEYENLTQIINKKEIKNEQI